MSLSNPEHHTPSFSQLCIELEHYETDRWAAVEVIKKEILTRDVVDPCAGTGVLSEVARAAGYNVKSFDIHDWGYGYDEISDFLNPTQNFAESVIDATIFMNPPFSRSSDFVEAAFEYGARKIVCFQRQAWRESVERRSFWDKYPPARVWVCGSRATCWRHDLPKNDKGDRLHPITGLKMSTSSTSNAWYVWERGHKGAEVTGAIYNEKGEYVDGAE